MAQAYPALHAIWVHDCSYAARRAVRTRPYAQRKVQTSKAAVLARDSWRLTGYHAAGLRPADSRSNTQIYPDLHCKRRATRVHRPRKSLHNGYFKMLPNGAGSRCPTDIRLATHEFNRHEPRPGQTAILSASDCSHRQHSSPLCDHN